MLLHRRPRTALRRPRSLHQKLEREGLRQVMLYPPLNRQYRVIEDFAERVMAWL